MKISFLFIFILTIAFSVYTGRAAAEPKEIWLAEGSSLENNTDQKTLRTYKRVLQLTDIIEQYKKIFFIPQDMFETPKDFNNRIAEHKKNSQDVFYIHIPFVPLLTGQEEYKFQYDATIKAFVFNSFKSAKYEDVSKIKYFFPISHGFTFLKTSEQEESYAAQNSFGNKTQVKKEVHNVYGIVPTNYKDMNKLFKNNHLSITYPCEPEVARDLAQHLILIVKCRPELISRISHNGYALSYYVYSNKNYTPPSLSSPIDRTILENYLFVSVLEFKFINTKNGDVLKTISLQ